MASRLATPSTAGPSPQSVTSLPMPADASAFFARNLLNFLGLLLDKQDGKVVLKDYLADEITAASLVTYKGEVWFKGR